MASDGRTKRYMFEEANNIEFETSEEVVPITSFDKMGLKEDLLRGIYHYGKSYKTTKITYK